MTTGPAGAAAVAGEEGCVGEALDEPHAHAAREPARASPRRTFSKPLRITQETTADAYLVAVAPSGTSIRIQPSCRDVSRSSPSPVRLICRSARVRLVPITFSTSSLNDTFSRAPLALRTY